MTPSVKAWLAGAVLVTAPLSATAADKMVVVKRIAVINELAEPVMATLKLLADDDKEAFFADTNENGIAEPNKACPPGMRIRVYPAVPQYLAPNRHPTCTETMRIALRRPGIGSAMLKIGDTAYEQGKYKRATLVYVEAATRLSGDDKAAAATAETKAYESAAQSFPGVTFYGFDPVQNKTVLTQGGTAALRKFQSDNDVPVTGKLDVRTAQSLAREPVVTHIKAAYDRVEGRQ
jgi:hypothetical protein